MVASSLRLAGDFHDDGERPEEGSGSGANLTVVCRLLRSELLEKALDGTAGVVGAFAAVASNNGPVLA